jgi:hypothetical protein
MLSSVRETRMVSPMPSAEQRADADGGFDAAVLAIAGFGDAEVDRVVPIRAFGVEAGDEQAVGGDHDLGVAGLHGEDELVVVVIAGDAGEFEGAFDHAERGVAVAVHDAVAEGSVVGADAHGHAAVLAQSRTSGVKRSRCGRVRRRIGRRCIRGP